MGGQRTWGVIAVAFVLVFPGTAGATGELACTPGAGGAIDWVGPTSGDWNNPSNWSGGLVPGPDDSACMDATGPIVVPPGVAAREVQTTGALTLQVDGATSLGSLQVAGTLTLTGLGSLTTGQAMVAASLHSTQTTLETGSLAVATDGIASTLDGPVNTETLMVGGPTTLLGDVTGLQGIGMEASLEVRGGLLETETYLGDHRTLAVSGNSGELRLTQGARIAAGQMNVDTTIRLEDCVLVVDELTAPTIDVLDGTCLDPDDGTRHIAGTTLLRTDATLDGGGTLQLTGTLELAPGVTLTDGATVLDGDVELGMTAAGTATFVDLGSDPTELGRGIRASEVRVDASEQLRFDSIRSDTRDWKACLAKVTGAGSVQFLDDTRRTRSCIERE